MSARMDGPLFETPHGAVLRCTCCGHLEITFMGGTLRIPPEDFATVAETVADTWNEIEGAETSAHKWTLRAETARGPVSVTFSPDEMAELHDLLHGAAAMLELDDLLAEVLQQ